MMSRRRDSTITNGGGFGQPRVGSSMADNGGGGGDEDDPKDSGSILSGAATAPVAGGNPDSGSITSKPPAWPKMIDLEYLIEKNKTSDRTVFLNVGGTRFEVRIILSGEI